MSELLNDIRKRIEQPGDFVGLREHDERLGVFEWESDEQWQARAVCQLFESAEPVDDSQLKLIDLPAELQAAARTLREHAEKVLDGTDSNDDPPYEVRQTQANRIGFLANVVEQTAVDIIPAPARVLQILQRDRDRWQQRCTQEMEEHAITTLALQQSQESNVALAHGQSELIGLLERVVVFGTGNMNGANVWIALMDDIKAKLNQVTAIETNAEGRLVVAEPQPTGGEA